MKRSSRAANRDGIAFGAAFFLSAFGYEVLFFAMTLRVYDISRKAINVGIFTAITFLPKIVSPAYGAIVDRIGARRALITAAMAASALSAGLGFATSVARIYALWLPLSALFIFAANARTVLMAGSVRAGGYSGGNALALSFLNAARLGAPLAAGFLSKSIGATGLSLAACGVYSLCAAAAFCLTEKAAAPARANNVGREKGKTVLASLGEGFARIARSPGLRLMTGVSAIRSLFLGLMPSLLVVHLTGRFGQTNAEYGIAMTLSAVGSLAGSLLGPSLAKALRPRVAGAGFLGAHFVCFAALGAAPSYPTALVFLCLGSFALYAATVSLHSKRDASADADSRGIVYGSNTAFQVVPTIVSMVAGGILADRFGTGPVFITCGSAAAIALLAVSARVAARKPLPSNIGE